MQSFRSNRWRWSFQLCGILSICCYPLAVWGQVEREPDPQLRQSREDALFGEEPSSSATEQEEPLEPKEPTPANAAPPGSSKASAKDGLAEGQLTDKGLLAAVLPPLTDIQADILTIGGQVFLRYQYTALPNTDLRDNPIVLPSLYDLFFDARPSDRLRIFFRGRLSYAPSGQQQSGLLSNPADPIPANTQVVLDQFWFKMDLAHLAFLTLGRQPIRWGSCRFWNPTDFMIRIRRDPLTLFDQRVGIDLLKLHLPIEALGWNFYLLADVGNSNDIGTMGFAARAEALFATTEIIVSAAKKPQSPWKLGFDISSAIGLFDVRWETALLYGVEQAFYRGKFESIDANSFRTPQPFFQREKVLIQTAVSTEISLKYSDTDTITFGAEYFYNQLGYDNIPYYLLFFQEQQRLGRSIPFLYLGQHYLGGFVILPKPGILDNSTIILTSLTNISDQSSLVRFDWQERLYTYLFLNLYASASFGGPGELHFEFDGQKLATNNPVLRQITLRPALWQAGIALRVNI